MHVTTFVAADEAVLEDGAANIRILPLVRLGIFPQFPIGVMIPIVASFWAETGEDLDPRYYIKAYDADGVQVGQLERIWHWPDDVPDKPFKFQVFTEYLPVVLSKEGFLRIGLYDGQIRRKRTRGFR